MIVLGRKKSVLLSSRKQIIPVAEHVDTLRVLGVTLNQQLNMRDHIDRTLSLCASSQFAFKTLRSHGLRFQELPDRPSSPPCSMPCRHGGALPPQSRVTDWRGFCGGSEGAASCLRTHNHLKSWLGMPIWGCLDLSAPTRATFLGTSSTQGSTLDTISVLERTILPSQ